jgi:hypothetical protein
VFEAVGVKWEVVGDVYFRQFRFEYTSGGLRRLWGGGGFYSFFFWFSSGSANSLGHWVVRRPPDRPIWGRPNHPRPNWVAATTYGVVRPPQHLYIFGFFFLNKICDEGILEKKQKNKNKNKKTKVLNCHNLKVWKG